MNREYLQVLPYTEYNDSPTMTKEFIQHLYHRVQEEHPGVVFYNGQINSAEDFYEHVTRKDVFFFVVGYYNTPVGLCWVNRLDITHAQIHFSWFTNWLNHDEKVEASKMVLDRVFYILPYSVLIGHIPSMNARAIEFAKDLGLKEVGRIPDLLWSDVLQAPIEGTVLYIQRKEPIDEDLHDDSMEPEYDGGSRGTEFSPPGSHS